MSDRHDFEGKCAVCGRLFGPTRCAEHHILADALRASQARVAELTREVEDWKGANRILSERILELTEPTASVRVADDASVEASIERIGRTHEGLIKVLAQGEDARSETARSKTLGECRHDLDALQRIAEESVTMTVHGHKIRVVNSADCNAVERAVEATRQETIKECIRFLEVHCEMHPDANCPKELRAMLTGSVGG